MNPNSTQMESRECAQSNLRAVTQFDCHPEQAAFAPRGIWASRATVASSRATSKSRVWLASLLNCTRTSPALRHSAAFICLLLFFSGTQNQAPAQKEEAHIHVIVDLVQLNVAVTDNKGDYITGLRPQDFLVTEDGIPQILATFAEGIDSTRRLVEIPAPQE